MRVAQFRYCLALLLCICSITGCAIGVKELRQHLHAISDKDEVVVVIYGDNLSKRGNIGDPASSWGESIKPRLAELFNAKISMINTSSRDNTFQYGYRNIQEDVLSFRPDIIFVMLGTLDAYSPGFLDTTVKKNLDRFFSELVNDYGKIIVITPPGLGFYRDVNDERKYRLDDYNELLRESAQYYQCVVFNLAYDMERLLAANPEEYRSLFSGPDELSPKGNDYVASFVYRKLKGIMEE